MLPGFRFLFAATMLSMSLLIFGLGAAALLRAAHESFATNASWRGAPEVPFAQHPETALPVLATLRVEPNAIEKAGDLPKTNDLPKAVAAADQQAASAEPARSDQVAALRPVEAPPQETVKPAEPVVPTPPAENPPRAEAASRPSAPSTEPATADTERTMTMAAISEAAAPAKSEPVKSEPIRSEAPATEPSVAPPVYQPVAASEPTDAPNAPADSVAATKIATLGGPAVDVTDETSTPLRTVKLPRARPDQAAIKKRVQARRALHRRRLALRARLLLQQQQANPFGQPQTFPPAAAAPLTR